MTAQPPTAAELTTVVSEVGRAVKELREERGMTKSALVVEAGISPSTLERVEGGNGNPRASTLESIAYALEVHTYILFQMAEGVTPTSRSMPRKPLGGRGR